MTNVRIMISVADEQMNDIDSLAAELRNSGMEVENVLGITGVITGSVDAAQLERLRGVAGVKHVEEERGFQIAPPESDVQ
jgi:hypothetical protein